MAELGGPTAWSRSFLRAVWLDGLWFEGFASPMGWQLPPLTGALLMADGASVEIRVFRGGSAPSDMRPRTIGLSFPPISSDEEYRRLTAVEASGRSVAFFPGLPLPDLFVAVQGQAQFSLLRFLAVGAVAGVTLDSHPVAVWLNDVPQTIVTGTPGAGEVRIVAPGPLAQHNAIVTPPLNSADLLRVEYYPLHYVRVQASPSYTTNNSWVWSGTLTEVFLGDYS